MAHKLDSEKKLWEKAAAFHGHVCPGLTIGYRAALYAIDLLGLTFSDDEQVVCIAENDACGVDAIQAILGCSIAAGFLFVTRPSVSQEAICAQAAQVSRPFFHTQLWMGQSRSQNGVFAPAMRQPVQCSISGVISTPLICDHSAAVFSRSASSFVTVAIRASHFSQSSPQQAINSFICNSSKIKMIRRSTGRSSGLHCV